MRDKIWEVVEKAWKLLDKDKVKAHLVGTAAIRALGHEVPCEDVDFLCETMPMCGESLPPDPQYRDGETLREMWIDGIKVNFILAGDKRAPFLAPKPEMVRRGVGRKHPLVPVAPLLYVLHQKHRAGRMKDLRFFVENPALNDILQFDIISDLL